MGRKPNQLILEFFERGQKLDDSSNRYQHICKLCNENFPKGRLDSLIAHLLKKCPNIQPLDRQRVLLQLSETPNQHGTPHPMAVQMRREQAASGQIDPAMQQGYNMSPLETLAEVSRQRLDSNGEYIPASGNLGKRRRSSVRDDGLANATSPNSFFEDVRQTAPESDESRTPILYDPSLRFSYSLATDLHDTNAQLLAGLHQFTTDNSSSMVDPSIQNSMAPTAQMIPAQQQQIAMAASAASELMPRMGMNSETLGTSFGAEPAEKLGQKLRKKTSSKHDQNEAIDPQLQDNAPQMQTFDTEDSLLTSTLTPQKPMALNPNLPHAHFLNDFSVSPGASKPKARGRFSPSRRKEVNKVRQQGACIRCRMLKKPCSGGTPCTTCKSVESARLWKTPCIRTRIAEEFNLYAQEIYTTHASFEVEPIITKNKDKLQPSGNSIEVSLSTGPPVQPISFPSARATSSDFMSIDPKLPSAIAGQMDSELDIIYPGGHDMAVRVDLYVRQASQHLFEMEASYFMRPTLLIAAELAAEKMDVLLRNALDLWAFTIVLVDPMKDWKLVSVPEEGSYNSSRMGITDGNQPVSRRMIQLQLFSAAEKRAAQIAKTLMNDLERRLLQRAQTSSQHFETFLTAIILLNCFEKMCWLYQSYTDKPYPFKNADSDYEPGMWPFLMPPDFFVSKGAVVGGVVTMLLKTRGIPPRSEVDEAGLLRAAIPPSTPGQTAEGQAPANMETVASWFNSVNLTQDELLKAQAPPAFDEKNCRCWDLRYIAPLLLPDAK